MFKSEGAVLVNEAFQQIIAPLHAKGIRPVIAGGFLRDAAMNRPFNDIDIVVQYGGTVDDDGDITELPDIRNQYCETLEHFGIIDPAVVDHGVWSRTGSHLATYQNSNILCQQSFPSKCTGVLEGSTVNLIGWGYYKDVSPKTVADEINIGICQIASDGVQMYWTEAFIKDMTDSQMTLLRTNWGLEGSMKHWMKLQAKYPWPLRLHVPA